MSNSRLNIGQMIYDLRIEQDIQQCELARAIGLHQSVLNRIEKGSRPARDTEIISIARFFNVCTDYLLGLTKVRDIKFTPPSPQALSLRLSDLEVDVVQKLRLLDERGRRTVTDTINREYDYIRPSKEIVLS